MARDLDYTVGVNTQPAVAGLEKLKGTIKTTSDSFEKFRNLFAGLALASFVRSAYQVADSISEIGLASGMGTQFVLGFSQAIKANGGELESAQASFGKFAQQIQSALGGNKDVIKSFESLGISLNDIATLTDKEIFTKTISGLAGMGRGATATALAQDLLGKKMASVDFAGVNRGLSEYVRIAGSSAEAVDSAGAANDSFNGAIATLQQELLKVLKPISDMVVALSESGESIRNFISIAVKIGMVIATFTVVGKAARAVGAIFGELKTAATAVGSVATTVTNGFRNFGAILENLKLTSLAGGFRVIGNLLKEFGSWALKSIPGVAALGVALSYIWDTAKGAVTGLLELLGISSKQDKATADSAAAAKKAAEEKIAQQVEIANKQKLLNAQRVEEEQKLQDKINAGVASERSAIAGKLDSLKLNNQEQLRAFELTKSLVGLSERERTIKEATADVENRRISSLAELTARQAELQRTVTEGTGSATAAQKEAAAVAKAELPLVEEAIKRVTAEYEKQIPAVQKLAAESYDAAQKQIAAENLKAFSVSETTRATDELLRLQDEMAMMTLPEIDRKYKEIEISARNSANAAIAAENERRRLAGLGVMSEAERAKYVEAASVGMNRLKDQTKANFEASRSWNTGWKRAFNDYVQNATNAAQQAQNIFAKATKGMEDMIVNFAKTGKFEWKSFISMMLEELLRSQIQQVFAQMMGNMSGTMNSFTGGGGNIIGNLLGSVGSLFGGGSSAGATPPFMPTQSSSSNVFGDLLGGIGSGITSVFSGIGDLFGGFFANGGNLGAGRWGIAGEAGPELISGPATVTPMAGGGVTNVTYNITATDAMSFKQLVAQDPGFIHAVVMQGAKSMPGTRR
jgi:lambda family phage tail tape measure protein